MATQQMDIRGTLLTVIHEQEPRDAISSSLQMGTVLREVGTRLGIRQNTSLEQALLTQWYDLFRTGYLAWGSDMSNPSAPFFHITEQGRRVLAQLSRDPGNPAGYLNHLYSVAKLGDIGRSYLEEAVECYVAGLYKAAAVMVGATAESVVLDLRDALTTKLSALGRAIPKQLADWRIKTVLDALQATLSTEMKNFPKSLREEFDSYWPAFTQQIRSVRNDAGHPVSVSPVSAEAVHASLLILPELLKLQNQLDSWIGSQLK